jgi:ABC-type transport system involved in resistance to organic solvents, periplasmic component
MVSSAQKFRLGLFIVIISVLMIIFLIMVAGNKLMEQRDTYFIRYEDRTVSGLQIGGPVKYYGISIGRVEDISIDPADVSNVIVEISVKAGTPIKKDIKASLTPIGITGLLQIELSGGTNMAENAEPGSFIQAGPSTFESITGKAEVISEKIELLLNNLIAITDEENQLKLQNILTNVDTVVDENVSAINSTMKQIEQISFELKDITISLNEITAKVNETIQEGHLDRIVANADSVMTIVAAIDIQRIASELQDAIQQTNVTLTNIDATHLESRQDILDLIDSLIETIDNLNEFSRMLTEDPTILIRSRRN